MCYVMSSYRGKSNRRPTRCKIATRSLLVILMFLLILCYFKVFRLDERPYCYFSSTFPEFIFFSYSLSPKRLDGFSWNFQGGVYLSGMAEANFWCDYVTFDPRYWRFSDFQGVVLYRDLLWNDSRYNLQIFRDDKQMAEVCTCWVSSLWLKKSQSAVGLWMAQKSRFRKHAIFSVFQKFLFTQKYFVMTYRTKKVQFWKIFHITSEKSGWLLSLGT